MPDENTRRKKTGLSEHQKDVRLLAGLAVIASFLLAGAILWLMTRHGFISH